MENISYLKVQELVKKIPTTKLTIAYNLLRELVDDKETSAQSPHMEYMRHSNEERRQILRQQAEQMKIHYEQNISNRNEWQAGDFIDNY
jgi:hypothetical protein